jgi:ABC-type branched-chain amino acid transport systems, ATPase component
LIELRALNAGYNKFHVLYDINVKFDDKRLTVIIGPNGSGKSSLLKSIFGLTAIYSGDVFFNGEKITGKTPYNIARRGIAYVHQVQNVFPNLTVHENLLLSGYILKREEIQQRITEVTEYYPILQKCYNRKAVTMSGGERQILAIAMALIRKPDVLLFDEPTANLSPKLASEVLAEIVKLRDNLGKTVILVEQNAIKALGYGDSAVLLVSGKVSFIGAPKDLLDSPELGALYLGIQQKAAPA